VIPEAVVPSNPSPLPFADALQRAESGLQQGQLQRALVFYDMAIAASPGSASAWTGKAETLYRLEQYLDAIAHCDKALALDPSHALARFNRAQALLALGRGEDGAQALRQFLDLAPPQLAPLVEEAHRRLASLEGR
jgi:tetratricopeptide (TPR) repeat protein